ncbi:MAG: SDR family NAD(P)-dependent oxidoreductase [Gammaproteobacteria bacterium]|nr:SDR family NAD(P)-dependent oxidoreductase [Gammaproteobacteria bacterium]
MSDFEDKVVIVTGAGNGLGRCHALAFAARGAKVVVNDLGGSVHGDGAGDSADLVVEEIASAGGTAIANKASVSDRDGAKSIVDDAVNAFGTVDIVVNNAGILRDKSFKNMTLDEFDLVLDVHLHGSAYVTHAAWPIMYDKNWGRIVFTSSTSGIFGNFGQANYAAAKMAMVGLMNGLAIEGAAHNVRVNCLAPGAATRMTASVPGSSIDMDNPPPEMDPALVTPAVLYMCSEDAPSAMTIHAAGGRYSRSQIFINEGLSLGMEADYDDLAEQTDPVTDMSAATPHNPLERRRRG